MVCLWVVTSPLLKILVTRLGGVVPHSSCYQVIIGGGWHRVTQHRGCVGFHGGGLSGVGVYIWGHIGVNRGGIHDWLRWVVRVTLKRVRHGRMEGPEG